MLLITLILSLISLIISVFIFLKLSNLNTEIHLQPLEASIAHATEKTIQMLQQQMMVLFRENREEFSHSLLNFQHHVSTQMTSIASLQENQLRNFSDILSRLAETNADKLSEVGKTLFETSALSRKELAENIKHLTENIQLTLTSLIDLNNQRIKEIQSILEEKIQQLQTENASKLDEMRQVVDEKLHATLEQRLGESFRLVSERLETVHRSLGEMHQLAIGVGDLKKVLTNVKTRGTWGEVQLGILLEQMLTPNQYAKNVETIPGSGAFVEYALKLPGRQDDSKPVWLPIDAKFPKEQYERLIQAIEVGDTSGITVAGKELENAVKLQAKTIAQKYLAPPYTTDFGLLFLPTEGLYAEVMRRPGLADEIQRLYRINIAGPSSLTALMNSLQMGFRTLAIEKRSSEVWRILGAVKTEFSKFGEVLDKTKKALERVTQNIDQAQTRTRVMSKKLKDVESLPDETSVSLLNISDSHPSDHS